MALLLTLFLGLFFLAGVLISKLSTKTEFVECVSIAVAMGAMIALGIFDLLPEAFSGEIKWYLAIIFIALGIGLLKVLDLFIPEHDENLEHIGIISVVAITLHNIIEGMTVYSIASQSINSGTAMAVGVGLHNIPMGMLIYTTLKNDRGWKEYVLIILSVVSTFIGGIIMAAMSTILSDIVVNYLVCIALGMVIYIIAFELLPSVLHAENKRVSIISSVAGFAVVLLSMLFE